MQSTLSDIFFNFGFFTQNVVSAHPDTHINIPKGCNTALSAFFFYRRWHNNYIRDAM